MKAVILQSAYIPWLGYFNLIHEADVFVFLDDVQWTIRDWRNRNRVRTPQGWSWLSVPTSLEKPYFEYVIKDVKIDNSQNWQRKHLGTLRSGYQKAPYFAEVYPLLENILGKKHEFVVDLNYELIFGICNYIGLGKTRFLFSQEMNISGEGKKTEKITGIIEAIGGVTAYLSGPAAKLYLDGSKFEEIGVEVAWHEYHHPYYRQNTWRSNIFISYLSVVDLLFNHGKESLGILSGTKIIEKPEGIQVVSADDYQAGVQR